MKRKILSIILAGAMAMGLLAGCGSSSDNNQAATDSKTNQSSDADESSDKTADNSTKAGSGKVLVVYYSATGSTKSVAETIAKRAGGDLFEIQPKEPYTDDDLNWSDSNSRVSKEHDNENNRNVELVSTKVDNWNDYDTVFIGYPIWWGIAAWPVDGFIKANDFTGKTVIPFCTSASSGMGDSGNLLKEMAGTGDWQEGERFRSGASEADVTSWVDSLGLNK